MDWNVAIWVLLTYIILCGIKVKVKTKKGKKTKDLDEVKLRHLEYSFRDLECNYNSLTKEEKNILTEKQFNKILEEIDSL